MPFTDTFSVGASQTGLLEPGSESQQSDFFHGVSFDSSVLHVVSVTYNLFSDDELGRLAVSCVLEFPHDNCFNLLREDGTFQQMPNGFFTVDGRTFNIYLKSDLEAVPEPTSLVLFGTALAALGVMRRRRKAGLPRQNNEFMT